MTDEEFLAAMKTLGKTQMLAAQAFDHSEYLAHTSDDKARVRRCIASGIANPDSAMGCYVGESDDVSRLLSWFTRMVELNHWVAQA